MRARQGIPHRVEGVTESTKKMLEELKVKSVYILNKFYSHARTDVNVRASFTKPTKSRLPVETG
jgi:hypothetical protein